MNSRAEPLQYYTWVDRLGITHFSEEPPDCDEPLECAAARLVALDVPVRASRSLNPDTDYYSIANQNRRMQARRREREKIRAERALELERLRLQREQLALQAYQAELWSRPAVVAGWHRDPGTVQAQRTYIGQGYRHRGKHPRGRHRSERRYGHGYGERHSYAGHAGRNRYGGIGGKRRHGGYGRGHSVGGVRPARRVGPGSRF